MMKSIHPSTFIRLLTFISLLVVLTQGVAAHAAESMSLSRYELGAGDKISISVFGEKDMEKELILTDAGTISYPFLGEFKAKGLTVGQLEALITRKLKAGYFIDPRVSVSIKEYRKFFVSGEVKSPGGFSFEPGLTLEKAVALAGGFTQRASKKGIMVTREENGRPSERELSLNDSVLPGDIIVINESFF
ncbi:polysaccharide biosynthesis/export family protein [Endozoicomonas elysicola]|uniref:Capsular biosynthesis protein n=1 Tax=Endozoicomonas elysicola TaxID=305900 RepID=A0A081K9C0_9GAMM|nr:polysaccharide biosynthesis/export family protein [Endozoicomonas elysicola]KEI70746.1 capsular biosynthesis protein [Endozoicomonas elysicola]